MKKSSACAGCITMPRLEIDGIIPVTILKNGTIIDFGQKKLYFYPL